MGNYEIEIPGVKISTRVVDRAALVDTRISWLKSALTRRVVGLDIKNMNSLSSPKLLILFVGTQCLIIQLQHLDKFPDSLKHFLADETICFVGLQGISQKVEHLRSRFSLKGNLGVEAGELAAKILKKPSLISCGYKDLAREIGINDIEISQYGSYAGSTQWKANAKVFTHEQVKLIIQDAYASFTFGNKLLGML